MEFSGKNIRVGCHSLLQGIFPTQGLNLGLLHCRQILYHLTHQGSKYHFYSQHAQFPASIVMLVLLLEISSLPLIPHCPKVKSFHDHQSFYWSPIYLSLPFGHVECLLHSLDFLPCVLSIFHTRFIFLEGKNCVLLSIY